MKKRTKVVIGIGISLLILVLGGLGFAGNYFYTLAIDAHSDKSVVFGNEEEDPKAAQASKDSYNEMMARDTKDVWMKNKDGYRLHAYEINQTGNKWVIVVHGYISEGAGENLFLVKNGKLYTPPTTSAILPGITRDTIMVLARDMGYEVVEQAIPREALYLADEIFMTGTAAEVTPARTVDGITVGCGRRGPITEKLQSAYFALVKGESEDKYGWLDYV